MVVQETAAGLLLTLILVLQAERAEEASCQAAAHPSRAPSSALGGGLPQLPAGQSVNRHSTSTSSRIHSKSRGQSKAGKGLLILTHSKATWPSNRSWTPFTRSCQTRTRRGAIRSLLTTPTGAASPPSTAWMSTSATCGRDATQPAQASGDCAQEQAVLQGCRLARAARAARVQWLVAMSLTCLANSSSEQGHIRHPLLRANSVRRPWP